MSRDLSLAILAAFLWITPAAAAGDAAAGQAKSARCASCHGQNGEGSDIAPKIAGENPDKFMQAFKEFKAGKRGGTKKRQIAASLSGADVANLAAYYSGLK